MSRIIEAIMEKSAPVNRHASWVHAKRVTAIWQTGFETGAHVQRKLRLVFTMGAHQQVSRICTLDISILGAITKQ